MPKELIRPSVLAGLMLLALAACGKDETNPAEADTGGGPQIATSLDDYALPVDESDQITAIDAATGDAGGMPRDGGAVVVTSNTQDTSAEETIATPAPVAPATINIPAALPSPAAEAPAPVPDPAATVPPGS